MKSQQTISSVMHSLLLAIGSVRTTTAFSSLCSTTAIRHSNAVATFGSSTALHAAMLYGHSGTRSPLVNWAAQEVGFDLTMATDLRKNPHPFGQLPCLVDDESVVVFESGAILQYIHTKTNAKQPLAKQAAITSWITWANASLDPICFLETPEGKVYDTGLKRPQKRIDQLEKILSESKNILGDDFTLADVAVASYLLYAVQFFPGIASSSLSRWPNMKRYMKECASRPAYAQAFGKNVQGFLVEQLSEESSEPAPKKILGMF